MMVLPVLWQTLGATVPPAVVLNGGCAMDLPVPIFWPQSAVSFLMLGGQDDLFRMQKGKRLTPEEYFAEAKRHVPTQNKTTAILLVNEMTHMPTSRLLSATLRSMIDAVLSWKATGEPPVALFESIQASLANDMWSGVLAYTKDAGSWHEVAFGRAGTPIMASTQVMRKSNTAPLIGFGSVPVQARATQAAGKAAETRPLSPLSARIVQSQPAVHAAATCNPPPTAGATASSSATVATATKAIGNPGQPLRRLHTIAAPTATATSSLAPARTAR